MTNCIASAPPGVKITAQDQGKITVKDFAWINKDVAELQGRADHPQSDDPRRQATRAMKQFVQELIAYPRRLFSGGAARKTVVVQFAVAALYERRKPLGIQVRRSQTAATAAADLDYSAIPPLDKIFFTKARAAWPPAKEQLTIRLDTDVLAWLKAQGRGYQTRINHILRVVMESQPPSPLMPPPGR